MRRAGAATAIAIALCASAARADPLEEQPPPVVIEEQAPAPADAWTERPLTLSAELGIGAPYGLAGAAVGYAFNAGLSLDVGAGVGASARSPQGAGMLRLRLPVGARLAVGTEGGLSAGTYEGKEACPGAQCRVWHWDTAVWGNLGVFVAARPGGAWALRLSIGAASVFNVVDGRCSGCAAGAPPGFGTTTIPYVALSAGWAVRP